MQSPETRGGHEAAGISRCSRWRGGWVAVRGRAQRDVAKQVGVAETTLYKHLPSPRSSNTDDERLRNANVASDPN